MAKEDAWKFDAHVRYHEVEIYLHLKPLCGKRVPSLRLVSNRNLESTSETSAKALERPS